jgi:uncharacterized protein YndB with AHSA1/START domain
MPQIILVEKSAMIDATPARVYKSLIEAKQLSRWLADRVESDPRQGGRIVIDYNTHEKRGEFRRLIPGVEVGINWTQYNEPLPIEITGFKLDKVAQGTRLRVVDFAAPEDAAELHALWAQRLKRLKKLHAAKSAAKKSASKKKPVTKRQTAARVQASKRRTIRKGAKQR